MVGDVAGADELGRELVTDLEHGGMHGPGVLVL